jgi:hypothetical protein
VSTKTFKCLTFFLDSHAIIGFETIRTHFAYSGTVKDTRAFVCRATRMTSMSAKKTSTAGEAIKMLDSPVLWNARIGYCVLPQSYTNSSIVSESQYARVGKVQILADHQ